MSFVGEASGSASDNTKKADSNIGASQYETKKTSNAVDNELEKSLVEFDLGMAPKRDNNGS